MYRSLKNTSELRNSLSSTHAYWEFDQYIYLERATNVGNDSGSEIRPSNNWHLLVPFFYCLRHFCLNANKSIKLPASDVDFRVFLPLGLWFDVAEIRTKEIAMDDFRKVIWIEKNITIRREIIIICFLSLFLWTSFWKCQGTLTITPPMG